MRFFYLFHRCILRDLFKSPIRIGLTVTGVALGTAVVVAIHLANARAIGSFNNSLQVLSGRSDLQITANGLALDETLMQSLSWIWDVGSMAPIVEGRTAVFHGQERVLPTDSLHILGVDLLSDSAFRNYTLRDHGNLMQQLTRDEFIELLLDPEKMIVPDALAERLDLTLGSRLSLLIGDSRRDFTVGAILRNEGIARAFAGNILFMDIAAAQLALNKIGYLDRIDVIVNNPKQVSEVQSRIQQQLPVTAIVDRPETTTAQNEKMLRAFRYNLSALSYISLIVGMILIYNTMTVAVVRRRSAIGILRTLGTTRNSIAAMFLIEAVLLGLIGSIVGIFLGELLSQLAGMVVTRTIQTLYTGVFALPSEAQTNFTFYLEMVVFVAVLAALSAIAPALQATRISPISVLREGTVLAGASQRPWSRALTGLVVFGVGVTLSFRPASRGVPFFGYAAAILFILGFALLTPLSARYLTRLLSRPLGKVFPVGGKLATQTMEAGYGRIAAAAMSLSIAVAMLVSVATMVSSFRETVLVWVNQTFRADLYIRPAAAGSNDWTNPLDRARVEELTRIPGVAAIDRFRGQSINYQGSPVTLAAGEFAVLAERGDLIFLDHRTIAQVAPQMIGGDRVIVSEPFALRQGVRRGDALDLPTAEGRFPFQVEAIFYDYSSDRGLIVMDRTTYLARFKDDSVSNVALYLKPGVEPTRIRAQIAQMLPNAHLVVVSNSELKRQVLRVFDQTFEITYALEVIAIVVAVLGIANILATMILERRPEIAMLRFIGADSQQLRKMVVIESGLIGILGAVLGFLLGMILSLLLIYVINRQSFGWTIQFALPVRFFAWSLAIVLVSTIAAGFYPASLAVRTDPIKSIRSE